MLTTKWMLWFSLTNLFCHKIRNSQKIRSLMFALELHHQLAWMVVLLFREVTLVKLVVKFTFMHQLVEFLPKYLNLAPGTQISAQPHRNKTTCCNPAYTGLDSLQSLQSKKVLSSAWFCLQGKKMKNLPSQPTVLEGWIGDHDVITNPLEELFCKPIFSLFK